MTEKRTVNGYTELVTIGMDSGLEFIVVDGLKQRDRTFMGLKVVTDWYMTETVEDWSDCRSPARARRRLKRGFPQRVKYREVPLEPVLNGNTIIMHPDTYARLCRDRG